jgi:hypothetical protein
MFPPLSGLCCAKQRYFVAIVRTECHATLFVVSGLTVVKEGEDHSSPSAGLLSSSSDWLLRAWSMVLTKSSSSEAVNRITASVRLSAITVRSTPPLFLTA